MTHDIDDLLQLAQQVAAVGAEVHRQGLGRPLATRAKSSETDLVSDIDLETERVMVARLQRDRSPRSVPTESEKPRLGRGG